MLKYFSRLQSEKEPPSRTAVYVFMIKGILGLGICYYLYLIFPDYPFDWAMVSVVLTLSFDNSKKFAVERIISNILGCMIGLGLFPVPLPRVLLLVIGVILVIQAVLLMKLEEMVRQALAAFVIVMLREENSQLWFIPLHRVITVIAGCLVALLLTLILDIFIPNNKCKNGSDQ